ncbi:MAG: hypothetical protein JSW71_08865 [Gemmatimonadota bacterium]|nr:MAG: hypothetical protein JSW71_08865 [Gemmatimonadota bacterium]
MHERLRFWRTEVAGVPQVTLCEAVNRYLAEPDRVGVTTVSNYERATQPRASFLAALKRVYPALNLDWLITGEGRPLQTSRGGLAVSVEGGPADRSTVDQLTDQPGMHRFRVLPLPAACILVAFLDEVRQSVPEYQDEQSRSWRDFLQRLSHFFFEPFQSTRHFVVLDIMSDSELTNYTLAVIGALRPLVASLRARQRAGSES